MGRRERRRGGAELSSRSGDETRQERGQQQGAADGGEDGRLGWGAELYGVVVPPQQQRTKGGVRCGWLLSVRLALSGEIRGRDEPAAQLIAKLW